MCAVPVRFRSFAGGCRRPRTWHRRLEPPPLTESLSQFELSLGLPEGFCDRTPEDTPAVREILARYYEELRSRAFVMGLMFAFLGVVEDLLGQLGEPSRGSALVDFPPEEFDGRGRPRNTLYIQGPQRGIGLRRYYNLFEPVVWTRLRRMGYPNMAPHATQAWPQHRVSLERLFSLSPGERLAVANGLWRSVVELPLVERRTAVGIRPRAFEVILRDFPNTQRREPPGAVLQGLAFAYYRADAPNVTLETSKVGAGRARFGGVGDIDGWSGSDLVLSIEVKDIAVVTPADVDTHFGSFLTNLSDWTDATAIALGRSFGPGARAHLSESNILVLDRATMLDNVLLWDLRKQQLAAREFEYFLARVQRHPGLLQRFREFLAARDLDVALV